MSESEANDEKTNKRAVAANFALDTDVNPSTLLGSGPSAGRSPGKQQRAHNLARTAISDLQPWRATTPQKARRIKQYEIIRELGRGGMGQVLLARDTRLGRRVAIKFLTSKNEEFTRRFLIEARTTAQVNHENIVVIHDVDEFENVPYMVLEYLEGETLAQHAASCRLSTTRIIELMIPVARALVRAHEAGIVHRDLKPDNIIITKAGQVKVLDFGIAKLFASEERDEGEQAKPISNTDEGDARAVHVTSRGAIMGTMPYMSPEQWGQGSVYHQTDIWAVGIMLFEMLANTHPVQPLTTNQLMASAMKIDEPLPSITEHVPDLPAGLAELVDGCLKKRQEERVPSAQALLEALEAFIPGRGGRLLSEGESPFPGLAAFQEKDSNRFFGRSADVLRALKNLRESPLLGIVGPSGIGKSSFVRAGLVPALRASGDAWQPLIMRPGKDPLSTLARLLHDASSGDELGPVELETMKRRIREEPGYAGTMLRERARSRTENIIVFVDQFEELYTLTSSKEDRISFTSALLGAADDELSRLRVILSIRSDFLDRVAESRDFLDKLSGALLFLRPLEREGLREALVAPVELAGYSYESPAIVRNMLDSLTTSDGALPLLQFAADKLWDDRDRGRQLLTERSYEQMGRLAGALASHANEVLRSFTKAQQSLIRGIFQRLVTPLRTRDTADLDELRQLSSRGQEVETLVAKLVQSRLLVIQQQDDAHRPVVEIVHESLITQWPTLRQWLDEEHEDVAFLQQLRTSARQWHNADKPVGLLWRGDMMAEATRFTQRFNGLLAASEREYLDAVMTLANRARRVKRVAILGSFSFLVILVVVGAIALFMIRNAEQEAVRQAETKQQALEEIQRKNALILKKDEETSAALQEVLKADQKASAAEKETAAGRDTIAMTEEQRESALRDARAERDRAERERKRAEQAQSSAEKQTAVAVAARAEAEQEKAKATKLLNEKKAELAKLQSEARFIKENLD